MKCTLMNKNTEVLTAEYESELASFTKIIWNKKYWICSGYIGKIFKK